jgi:hypothetical protein
MVLVHSPAVAGWSTPVSGTDSGFVVHAGSLEAFAQTSEERAGEFQHCDNELKAATVGPDAFGHLPFVGDRARHAYDRQVSACDSSLVAAATTMRKISMNIQATIANYAKADTEVEDAAAAAVWKATNPDIVNAS